MKFTHLSLLSVSLLWVACENTTDQHSRSAIVEYIEPGDPNPVPDSLWNDVSSGINVSFVSSDHQFPRSAPPPPHLLRANWRVRAWRGERVHTQVLIWSIGQLRNTRMAVGKLTDGKGNEIGANMTRADFVRYVMTDHLDTLGSGCNIPEGLDSSIVADVIDNVQYLDVSPRTSRPVWLRVDIPADTEPGVYQGTLRITALRQEAVELPFQIEVLPHVLPAPNQWTFHLDLWQNPFSVSRYYEVRPWTDDHFRAMRPYMQMLAHAGQKVITASIIHDPWNSQTYDPYGSMIRWIKRKDGSWQYDYTVFDRWVEFMMSFGIDKSINCYSMIPWNLNFHYYDETLGKENVLVAKPDSEAYRAHWLPMLTDFARHLKAKGWFDITTIAMDERTVEDMLSAMAVIKEADSAFKVSLAGSFHAELTDELVDFSITSPESMDGSVLQRRAEQGYITTFYTCCVEPSPNTFTSSPYAESTWLSWHALNKRYDGYLRWAYNSWNENPLQDTRFGKWAAGDTYLIYPGSRTSIRFERLREGIQDYEKSKIVREHLEAAGKEDEIAKLDEVINLFSLDSLKTGTAADAVNRAKGILNNF